MNHDGYDYELVDYDPDMTWPQLLDSMEEQAAYMIEELAVDKRGKKILREELADVKESRDAMDEFDYSCKLGDFIDVLDNKPPFCL